MAICIVNYYVIRNMYTIMLANNVHLVFYIYIYIATYKITYYEKEACPQTP